MFGKQLYDNNLWAICRLRTKKKEKYMNSVREFAHNFKVDIATLSKEDFVNQPKSVRDELIQSLALRIIGVLSLVISAVSFAFSGLSLLGFQPITAIGWSTVGVAAGILGHDLIKCGNNMRLVNTLRMKNDDDSNLELGMLLSNSEGQGSKYAFKGTWLFEKVYTSLKARLDQRHPEGV